MLIQAIFEHVWVAIESRNPRWTLNPQNDCLPGIDFLWWFLTLWNIAILELWYNDWHEIDPFHTQWNWLMAKIRCNDNRRNFL